MAEAVQRKQCTNLVTIWTKASKEILGARDLIFFCTDGLSILSASRVWRGRNSSRSQAGGAREQPTAPSQFLCLTSEASSSLGKQPSLPKWGLLGWRGGTHGASCIPLSPLGLLRVCSCRSRDATLHSATRFLLSSHYLVVFIDLLEKNLCMSLLHCQDSL